MKPTTSERELAIEGYRVILERAAKEHKVNEVIRLLCKQDIFFLGYYVLLGDFFNNDWVFARCREFQGDPDGHLDLWPREHYKSTIITLVAVVWKILNDPEITIGIFSFTRPIAKAFLRSIKWQFESNQKLKELFPDILYADPDKEAPKWSEDDGIVVKRQGFPKEMTIEASGLIDGMPTSKHYQLMVYDDVVTDKSVSTPEMIRKVTDAVLLSFNLGKSDGSGARWMLGTRYNYADTYSTLVKMGAVKLRLYAATKDGKFDGEPWLWTREVLAKKIQEQGTYIASCQLFNNPVMEGEETFKPEWVQFWNIKDSKSYEGMNIYLLCDPAGEKNKTSDYTTIFVYGLAGDHNYYVIDMVRDKLSLSERCDKVMRLHMMYHPLRTGYEKYGMQSDIEYLKILQDQRGYRFPITPLGGTVAKNDRIKWLQPVFEAKRFYLPDSLMRSDHKGVVHDLSKDFLQDEYYQFPYMVHDDMLDCASRIMDTDMATFFPDASFVLDEKGRPMGRCDSYDIDTYAYI